MQTPTLGNPPSGDRERLEARVRAFGPWFHNFQFGEVSTAPDHPLGDYPRQKWQRFAHAIPPDLRGRTVLDIGCNAGFYALEMKRRGADRVVGIDSDERYLAQARFAAEMYELDVEFRRLSTYDVHQLHERFDIVLFMGVLYHLRHPLLALDHIHAHVTRDVLVFQSMLRGRREPIAIDDDYPFEEREMFEDSRYPALYFVERRYAGDPTNWWVPNHACAAAMLRSAGFRIESEPEDEVFVCRHAPAPRLEDL